MEHLVFVLGHAHASIKSQRPLPRVPVGKRWLGKIQLLPDDIRLCNSISRPSNAVKGDGRKFRRGTTVGEKEGEGYNRDKTRSKSGNLIHVGCFDALFREGNVARHTRFSHPPKKNSPSLPKDDSRDSR